jgi:hypothetical protein
LGNASGTQVTGNESQDLRVADLERRIDELDGQDESAFGEFTRADWVVCVIGAVLLPGLAVIWFAR